MDGAKKSGSVADGLRERLIDVARSQMEPTGRLTLSRRELATLAGVAPLEVSRNFRTKSELVTCVAEPRSPA